jgi:uncharacterized protein DUF6713
MAELGFLYLALALIWTHELDAIDRHEWRVMPLLNALPDATAKRIFLWMHVPLMYLTILIAVAGPGSIGAGILTGFCVVHVGLHWLFRNHPANEFSGAGSQALILGAGGFGALYWLVQLAG